MAGRTEMMVAPFRGETLEQRILFYFYKGLEETLLQERAQLARAEGITHKELFDFGVSTMFGGALGKIHPMTYADLIEVAEDVQYIKNMMRVVEKIPSPEHKMCMRKPEDGEDKASAPVCPMIKRGCTKVMCIFPTHIPCPDHEYGHQLLEPFFTELKTKISVMQFKAFRETPVRKYLAPVDSPDERPKSKPSQLTQLLNAAKASSSGEQPVSEAPAGEQQ